MGVNAHQSHLSRTKTGYKTKTPQFDFLAVHPRPLSRDHGYMVPALSRVQARGEEKRRRRRRIRPRSARMISAPSAPRARPKSSAAKSLRQTRSASPPYSRATKGGKIYRKKEPCRKGGRRIRRTRGNGLAGKRRGSTKRDRPCPRAGKMTYTPKSGNPRFLRGFPLGSHFLW